MSFWKDETGKLVTGQAKEAFIGDFGNIPDGTIAEAFIKHFKYVETQSDRGLDRVMEIKWKLLNGEFKNREVAQKLKVFDGKPEAVKRNKNMFLLILKLFDFKLTHADLPSDDELMALNNKVAVIKIGEWEWITPEGKPLEGNNIKEVHPAGSMQPETGVHRPSATSTSTPTQGREKSAFDRERERQAQASSDLGDDLDVPF